MSTQNLLELLREDFPREALGKDTSRGFELISIKAQFIIERLCEVFGPFGWEIIGQYETVQGGILFNGKLIVKHDTLKSDGFHKIETVGYSPTKKNMGDAYKSAKTDALSKAASYLLIGNSVFKGQAGKQTQNNHKETATGPGAFIIRFGKKYKGKCIADVPEEDLIATVEWLEKQDKLTDGAKAFIENVEKYLGVN